MRKKHYLQVSSIGKKNARNKKGEEGKVEGKKQPQSLRRGALILPYASSFPAFPRSNRWRESGAVEGVRER